MIDLGSGAGFDAFLAARQVGETGSVIGVDMTAEMIAKARGNIAKTDLRNVGSEGSAESSTLLLGRVRMNTSRFGIVGHGGCGRAQAPVPLRIGDHRQGGSTLRSPSNSVGKDDMACRSPRSILEGRSRAVMSPNLGRQAGPNPP